MFHSFFIVLKILLSSMSSRHDPVISMFHCLFIVLKISLFSMSPIHDRVIRMFQCVLTVLNVFSMPQQHYSIVFSTTCIELVIFSRDFKF